VGKDPVLILNFYYPRPGHLDAVLETRLEASEVRASLALPRGRVLHGGKDAEGIGQVLWECGFDDLEAHELDMTRRAESAAFEAVRARMHELVARFERTAWEVVHVDPQPDESPGQGSITVLNAYYSTPAKADSVAAHRIHASEVRLALGFHGGRVLRRVHPAPNRTELPQVLWQMDYPNAQARREDFDAISATPQFQAVMTKMRGLADRFERGLWEVAAST